VFVEGVNVAVVVNRYELKIKGNMYFGFAFFVAKRIL